MTKETLSFCIHGTPVKLMCKKCLEPKNFTETEFEIRLKRIEESFKDVNYLYDRLVNLEKSHEKLYDCHDKLEKSFERFYEQSQQLDSHVNKLHEMINIDDRIKSPDVLDRIKKLEEAYKVDFEVAKDIIFNGAQTHASILRCEAKYKELDDWVATIKANMLTQPVLSINVENIYKKIDELEAEIATVRALGSRAYHPKKPYKCPVCDFTGAIQLESAEESVRFKNELNYTSDGKCFIWCKACKGQGIVWG